jgi:hypothetical protein
MTDNAPSPVQDHPFRKARFDAALGDTFSCDAFAADGSVVSLPLELIEINVRKSPANFEQFSAQFVGPANPALSQGNYQMRSPNFGEESLFLVPVGLDASRRYVYEAAVVISANL